MFDDDFGTEMEAIETERLDADIEQYEMEAAGDAIARAERAGICTHGSAAGYHYPPIYPEQEGLQPGQLRCTKHTGGCQRVFASDEDWYAAMDEAVSR
jgi:hypothetical protein